ncbi:hypothetical protein [Methanosarcina mazei]|uniref:hypothetical protein n=1 Tax=Methanosarcina mazei TaxID=2209 RepID=UPI0012FEFC23|nr:hypothetical protein [Methanosarcina mazei]WIM42683.1 hypothetical protein PSF70_14475 [Methanosarcina mazei]WIM46145.1 hypothetical protein PQQ20_14370 [Methanosarcina mazei]
MVSDNLRPVMAYVDVETYNKIEAARKRISRSAFVANILTDVFADFDTPEIRA